MHKDLLVSIALYFYKSVFKKNYFVHFYLSYKMLFNLGVKDKNVCVCVLGRGGGVLNHAC